MLRIQKIQMLLLTAILLLAFPALADIVVITNKATRVDSLTASEVKDLFLQKKKRFPDGSDVVLGDQNNSSPARKELAKKVLGKSLKKLNRYWSKRVFAGKGIPPKVVGDDADMKAWVAKTPNSLGYINAASVDASVKVLYTP